MKGNIKIIKHSLKQLKSTQKKLNISNLIKNYKTNIKKTWQVIRKALEKQQVKKKLM